MIQLPRLMTPEGTSQLLSQWYPNGIPKNLNHYPTKPNDYPYKSQ